MIEPLHPHEHPQGSEAAQAAQRVRQLGGTLVTRLHALLRSLQLYGAGNDALREHLRKLFDALQPLMRDEVTVLALGDYLYVNGNRLRPEGSQLAIARALLTELQTRGMGGLRFGAALSPDELDRFLRILIAQRTPDAIDAIETAAARVGVQHVSAIRPRRGGGDPESDEHAAAAAPGEHHRVRLVFSRAVRDTRELMRQSAQTKRPALRQARRVVQPIVDRLLREQSLVGLTAVKRHDEYTYAHCVNVSIISLRMGQILGLSRTELASLGVAALLHDTGKVEVPAEVLRKPGKLDEHEWAAIRRHPLEGLRILSRLPGLSELMLDAMRVAFEHHRNVDLSGYPGGCSSRGMSAFSRIVAVADCYDAVTSHRSYRRRPMTSHEALRLLLGRERDHFDPAVLWALVHAVGLYPPGSLLSTSSGRRWLSIMPGADDLRRPVCRELLAGDPLVPAPRELDAPLPADEQVTHVLAPEDLAVDVDALLVA